MIWRYSKSRWGPAQDVTPGWDETFTPCRAGPGRFEPYQTKEKINHIWIKKKKFKHGEKMYRERERNATRNEDDEILCTLTLLYAIDRVPWLYSKKETSSPFLFSIEVHSLGLPSAPARAYTCKAADRFSTCQHTKNCIDSFWIDGKMSFSKGNAWILLQILSHVRLKKKIKKIVKYKDVCIRGRDETSTDPNYVVSSSFASNMTAKKMFRSMEICIKTNFHGHWRFYATSTPQQ